MGRPGADSLRGLDMTTSYPTSVEDETLTGDAGADTRHGGTGDDTVRRGAGDDIADGNGGYDSLDGGGNGTDHLNGGPDTDTWTCGHATARCEDAARRWRDRQRRQRHCL